MVGYHAPHDAHATRIRDAGSLTTLSIYQADGDGNAPSRLARAEGFVALAAWLEAAEAEAAGAEAEAAEAAHAAHAVPATGPCELGDGPQNGVP